MYRWDKVKEKGTILYTPELAGSEYSPVRGSNDKATGKFQFRKIVRSRIFFSAFKHSGVFTFL